MHRSLLFVLGFAVGSLLGYLMSGGAAPPSAPPAAAAERDRGGPVDAGAARGGVPAAGAGERASGPDAAPAREVVAKERVGIEYDPAFGTLLYGTVTSRDGTPIESCSLSFTDPDDNDRRFSASVDGGSGYAVTGLGPGRWKVWSRADNHAPLQTEIEVLDVAAQRHDFVFEPSFLITVKLRTPDGTPLHEAMAAAELGYPIDVVCVASPVPLQGNLPMTDLRGYSQYGVGRWRGAHGIFGDRDEPAAKDVSGTLELSEPPPVHVAALFRHVVLAQEVVARGQDTVELTVAIEDLRASLSTIAVQVVDAATGLPIEGARVAVSDAQSGGGGRPTDAQGRVAFENERVGVLELEIWAKDRARHHQLLRVAPGPNDLGVIRMQAPTTVELEVVLPTGAPAAGAMVLMRNLELIDFPQSSRGGWNLRADAEGRAKADYLAPGRYLARARVDGECGAVAVVDTNRLAGPQRIQLQPVGAAVFAPAMSPPRSRVHCLTVYDAARLPVWSEFVRGYDSRVELPPGRYTWELHEDLTLLGSGDLVVEAGQAPQRIEPR